MAARPSSGGGHDRRGAPELPAPRRQRRRLSQTPKLSLGLPQLPPDASMERHTALRCRAMQVSSTSPPGRFHQSSLEKISTSL